MKNSQTLLVLNENSFEPTNYTERRVVKGVVVNNDGDILHLSSGLIGGGVDEGETDEGALYREALEETGMKIEILKPLGEVIGYRDVLERKYVIRGYFCKYLETASSPTTSDADELRMEIMEKGLDKAIEYFHQRIKEIEQAGRGLYPGDKYQSKLFNAKMALAFLEKVLSDELIK